MEVLEDEFHIDDKLPLPHRIVAAQSTGTARRKNFSCVYIVDRRSRKSVGRVVEEVNDIGSDLYLGSFSYEIERELLPRIQEYDISARPIQRVNLHVPVGSLSRLCEACGIEPQSVYIFGTRVGIAAGYQVWTAPDSPCVRKIHSAPSWSKGETGPPGKCAAKAPIPNDAIQNAVRAIGEALSTAYWQFPHVRHD